MSPLLTISLTFADRFSSIILVVVIIESTWFERKFGVRLSTAPGEKVNHNDPQLHMIVYLQVAIISQALIFVTRSHGFFFMERPSFALMGAFGLAQLVSSIIAAYADWGFTNIHSISGGWIGIVWVWVRLHVLSSVESFADLSCRTLSGSFPSTGSSSG